VAVSDELVGEAHEFVSGAASSSPGARGCGSARAHELGDFAGTAFGRGYKAALYLYSW